jgi:hypothetical protein
MYANSTGTNYPVAKSIVTSEMVTTTEGSTLILKCPPSSSKHTLWEKSSLTDFKITTYAEDKQINLTASDYPFGIFKLFNKIMY